MSLASPDQSLSDASVKHVVPCPVTMQRNEHRERAVTAVVGRLAEYTHEVQGLARSTRASTTRDATSNTCVSASVAPVAFRILARGPKLPWPLSVAKERARDVGAGISTLPLRRR